MTDSIEPNRVARSSEDELVRDFVQMNSGYYEREFRRIDVGARPSFNIAAALGGPVWAAARRLLPLFWLLFFLNLSASIQIGVATFGEIGAPDTARADRLERQYEARRSEAEAAGAASTDNAAGLRRSADALRKASENARKKAAEARARAPIILASGVVTLALSMALGGLLANWALERRFMRWRSNRKMSHGASAGVGAMALGFCMVAYFIAAYKFAVASPPGWIAAAPANLLLQSAVSNWLDDAIHWLSSAGSQFFSAISITISAALDAFAFGLIGLPWPLTMAIILLLAFQVAGVRVLIFSAGALTYLAVLGFWDRSMETLALLGTAAILCLVIGIPLGIVCGRRPKFYSAIQPVLDFMQTMPAFVYLIPVIALFGIGKPPGVIATLIFGTPPVTRLTALGIRGVPENVREAATAFGATKWFILTRVDLPLAWPSIMAGINQTILMCLSMVVIASLIGAKGLGEDVLNALQYAAVGQGLLAGFAILLCAMVIDRIVQGAGGAKGH